MIPLVFGILVLWVSKSVEKISGPLWMVPLGIHPHGFYTLDYEPLFPWFGVILIGIAVGVGLHPKGKRDVSLSFLGKNVPPVLKFFSFLGRHSLIVYLGYQLVILGGLVLIIGV
ncbi:MAG: heparan-alpha-glucosaminide N-acetyltransferase domain-containing protein [Aliarcobacter butzleri]|nr:heparan-alpha-glucosaminide N-acetyltransferase domain-containing protein [Aliarcobacter butzleri]